MQGSTSWFCDECVKNYDLVVTPHRDFAFCNVCHKPQICNYTTVPVSENVLPSDSETNLITTLEKIANTHGQLSEGHARLFHKMATEALDRFVREHTESK